MKISQAAAESGLTVKTVRYYANIGLVRPIIDTATGYRHYDAANCWRFMRTKTDQAVMSKKLP